MGRSGGALVPVVRVQGGPGIDQAHQPRPADTITRIHPSRAAICVAPARRVRNRYSGESRHNGASSTRCLRDRHRLTGPPRKRALPSGLSPNSDTTKSMVSSRPGGSSIGNGWLAHVIRCAIQRICGTIRASPCRERGERHAGGECIAGDSATGAPRRWGGGGQANRSIGL